MSEGWGREQDELAAHFRSWMNLQEEYFTSIRRISNLRYSANAPQLGGQMENYLTENNFTSFDHNSELLSLLDQPKILINYNPVVLFLVCFSGRDGGKLDIRTSTLESSV